MARHGTTGPSSEVSHSCSGAGSMQAPASRTGALGGTGLELGLFHGESGGFGDGARMWILRMECYSGALGSGF